MSMYPVLFHIGPLTIYSFGAMMALAFLVAGELIRHEMERRSLPAGIASNLVFAAAVGGLVGARVWAILEDIPAFLDRPWHMIFSGSGFVWYGGLLGGLLATSLLIRRHGLPWLRVADCVAPGLALAHGIGRVGCQLAGDGDWGTVSTLPWAMAYPRAIVGWNYPPGVRVHPTPVYELIAYAGIFALLWGMRKRPQEDGTLFWWYLILAPAARFLVEFVRHNAVVAFGLTTAQIFSLLLMATGALALRATRGGSTAAAAAPPTSR